MPRLPGNIVERERAHGYPAVGVGFERVSDVFVGPPAGAEETSGGENAADNRYSAAGWRLERSSSGDCSGARPGGCCQERRGGRGKRGHSLPERRSFFGG